MSQEGSDKPRSLAEVLATMPAEERTKLEALVDRVEKLKEQGWSPTELGDPKVFARLGADGRLIAIRADVTLQEKLGHLYSLQGKTSITAAGYARINSITALNVITPTAPKLVTDPDTGRLKAVEVRKMCIGFAPSGSLLVTDSTLVFDLDAYRLHELAKLAKHKPTAVKFILKEEVEAMQKKDGKLGWLVPYEDPVMLWVDIRHEDVRDELIADSQRRKFAERIASTICWRNAIKTHAAIAQAQVLAQGPDKARTAVVRVFGFRHDLDRAAMTRLAAGIVEGRLDVVKETLKTIPGASQEVLVERQTTIAGAEDIEVEVGSVVEDEEGVIARGETELSLTHQEPQEERERLQSEVQAGAEALSDQVALSRLMKEAGVTDLKVATVAQLHQLNQAISKEVSRADHQAQSKRTQGAK